MRCGAPSVPSGPNFFRRPEDGIGLDIVDAFPQQDVCNLAGNALDMPAQELACGIMENKPACGLSRSGGRIHCHGGVGAAWVFLSAHSGKPSQEKKREAAADSWAVYFFTTDWMTWPTQ